MKPIMKKLTISAIAATTFGSLFIAAPSYGISINDFFSSIVSDFQTEISKIQDDAKEKINISWAGIKTDAIAAIDSSIGQLGAPDPIASADQLKDSLKDDYSYPVAQQNAQQLERQLTLASVSSIVSKDGQQQTQEKIDTTAQIAQQAKSIADEAQNMDASQNVLKAIAAQNGLIVSMLAEQRTDSLSARQDNAYSNLMLTQVAEHLDSERKKENSQEDGRLSLVHEIVLNARLDPASAD
ncbi:conserved hypothetical protein (plasmid) [Trichormus variabilis ATCC 29413]|uniref:Uncharacterized protein n=3 Tax=Anabaena variabilis TaxID=264691 RepID=Q3M2Q5_TRIV2|nr:MULTISPECIES: hypothetical protein [Nostocaceae]MBC1305654.1 hypothetical protein [Trichormus variabilis N2B]MBC1314700.1 hypothetical protein [Trichormus variabilis PNB]MBC1329909.1 hypothetical protein [Trichormus variabilis 9RC]ABA24731.1 conserved hypothetical protein [Trichormus variabilis ATCC 29413]MBC1217884.1 hypothetical protein [Trichormus variabilis ARAD]